MLWSDAREMWNGSNMADPRVMQYWDGEHVIGQWFAKQVDGYDGIAWDVYYLYGPDATWKDVPSLLSGSGSTIYGERQTLEMQVSTLLNK